MPRTLPPKSNEYIIATKIKTGQKLCDVRGGPNAIHTWDIPEVFGDITNDEKIILEVVRSLRRKERRRIVGDSDPVSLCSLKKDIATIKESQIDSLVEKGYLRKIGEYYDLAYAFNGWYRRLDPLKYSPTVDTRFGRPKYFLHPTENRGLTIREAARLQTFPDDFIFEGSEEKQYKMIGNAVPPRMSQAIATYVRHNIIN
jgi:DNA (cytosine-5)-methyltransferase 1